MPPSSQPLPSSHKILLYVIVFFCGAAVMIIELVGSRVIAPYVGTSVYVWTSLIGVILGSLSLGYYVGGRFADRGATLKGLATILLFAGISTVAILYIRHIAYLVGSFDSGLQFGSLIIASILFVPSTFFFGMITPYATRIRLYDISTSGRAVGSLYALSTLGSILGTFLGGFFLISYFGNARILLVLGIISTILALIVALLHKTDHHFLNVTLFSIGLTFFGFYIPHDLPVQGTFVAEKDTRYKRVWVYDSKDRRTNRDTRILTDTIFAGQSGMFLDNPTELLFDYQKYFDLAFHFVPDGKQALMIGAGAFTYPPHYFREKSDTIMDVVEIDPALQELTQKYFYLPDEPRLSIIHQDGRIFLNQTKKTYDTIIVDAFTSFVSIPYQLTTREAVAKMYDHLEDNGTVLVNIISGIEGYRGEFLRAEYATYRSIFPTVLIFKVNPEENDSARQNIILVALKGTLPSLINKDPYLNTMLTNVYKKTITKDQPILEDNFAPVEKYTAKLLL